MVWRTSKWRWRLSVAVAGGLMLFASALSAPAVRASGPITFRDDAGVLFAPATRAQISAAAATLPVSLTIWTVPGGFAGDDAGFGASADSLVGQADVVIAVDTQDSLTHVVASQDSGISPQASQRAAAATGDAFMKKKWADGIVAAIESLKASGTSAGGDSGGPPVLVFVLVVAVIAGAVYGARRYRRTPQQTSG